MLICSRFSNFKTEDGELPLTNDGYGPARVHLSKGIAKWANESRSNMSRLNRLLTTHASKLAKTRKTSGTIVTGRDFSGADTAHVTSEIKGRRSVLSWVAFSSEI